MSRRGAVARRRVTVEPPTELPIIAPAPLTLLATSTSAAQFMQRADNYRIAATGGLPAVDVEITRSATPTSANTDTILITCAGTTQNTFYTNQMDPSGANMLTALANAGIATYAYRFPTGTNFLAAPNGVRTFGHSRMMTRFASIVNHIKSMNGWTSPTVQGTGPDLWFLTNSNGGNSALHYNAWYDPARTTKKIVFTAGPHPYYQRQCGGTDPEFAISGEPVSTMHDNPYGYPDGTGPCFLGAGTTMEAQYNEVDPTVNPAANLDWTGMDVRFLHGSLDFSPFEGWVRTWIADMGRPSSLITRVTGGEHVLQNSAAGITAIQNALLA